MPVLDHEAREAGDISVSSSESEPTRLYVDGLLVAAPRLPQIH